jgi:predicted transcriptional regulator/DNA-binding XRE family transcriptional regulator
MRSQKLYAGVQLRETRRSRGLTQKDFADRLGISLSYLNQMENNHRPISAAVVLSLADEFGFDVTTLSVGETQRLVANMREALADPVFGTQPDVADLTLTASNATALAHAFLELHRAYRQAQERLASLDEALDRPTGGALQTPWEEVRDFLHYCDNYIDPIDRAAERFAETARFEGRDKLAAGIAWLADTHGIATRFEGEAIRRFDAEGKTLTLPVHGSAETNVFQLAHQVALIAHDGLIEATLDLARFRSSEARAIARIGLANYFAGAAILPYGATLTAARDLRHDLDALAHRFGTSVEQIGHRLSTLQRPGSKGIPFFFARVDQAGTITKRHSSTRLQFARFGGACPLWNVHQAFATPGRILRQLAETPDGVRYICLARDVIKRGASFRAPSRRYAIALGCEVKYADQLIYADDLDTANAAAFEPIGVSCRICERRNCHQRSVPPVEKALSIDPNRRELLPYRIG